MELFSWINEVEAFDTATDDVAIVHASIIINGKEFKTEASSKRNPLDTPDPIVGVQLATARALRRLAKQVEKAANVREADNARADAQRRRKRSEDTLEGRARAAVTLSYRAKALKSKATAKKTSVKV